MDKTVDNSIIARKTAIIDKILPLTMEQFLSTSNNSLNAISFLPDMNHENSISRHQLNEDLTKKNNGAELLGTT